MAKNITISLSTVFNGSGIKSAIYGMQEMQNVTKNVQQSLEGTKSSWERTAAAFESTVKSIERLNGVVQSMASAYSNAELNATRLEVIMRQRMKSTDAEIASIKKLTSAQADLGIISAGVQRAQARVHAVDTRESGGADEQEVAEIMYRLVTTGARNCGLSS